MTLIDDDQIKEVRRELLVDVLRLFRPSDGLIQSQIDLVRLVGGAVRDLGQRLTKRLKVIGLGLIREDVAVDEEQNPLLRP